jgi:hypothetical protein
LLCKKSAHWDGYFSGVGDCLCTQIKRLLEKYSIPEINAMLDALEVEESESHNFNTDDLIPFIEGKTAYGNDMCDDIEYEYRLDFHNSTFEGSGNGEKRVLRLDQIRAGKQISSEDTDDDDTDAKEDETAAHDKVATLVEMARAGLSTLNDCEKRIALNKIKDLV